MKDRRPADSTKKPRPRSEVPIPSGKNPGQTGRVSDRGRGKCSDPGVWAVPPLNAASPILVPRLIGQRKIPTRGDIWPGAVGDQDGVGARGL